MIGCRIAFSDTWCNNCQSGMTITKTCLLYLLNKIYFSFSIFGVNLKKIINVCLHFIDLKLNTNEGNVKDGNSFINIYFIYKQKIKEKKPSKLEDEKK